MEQIINEIKSFKEKILAIKPKPIKILHIGSNCRKREQGLDCNYENDFDIIIVVSDTTDCFDYIKKISSILKTIIIENQIFITAYPIKQSIFEKGESEFLHNVRNKANEIWTN